MSDGFRDTVGIRPGHGFYDDADSARELPRKLLDVVREAERCRAYPGWRGSVVYEQENYPHFAMQKSAEAIVKDSHGDSPDSHGDSPDSHGDSPQLILNNVMKYLTAATIFLAVPTLVASIYGMNLTTLPFMNSPHSFAIVMGFSGLLAVGIGALFVVLSHKRKF